MASNPQQREFAHYIVDLLQSVGPVTAKPMFGGFGLFLDGLMFGLIADSALYFKADSLSKMEFEQHDLAPFTYFKQNKPMQLSYWQAPDECLDSSDAMLEWGSKGYLAAQRAASDKSSKTKN
jgi:DNA transformation protein and related proteins